MKEKTCDGCKKTVDEKTAVKILDKFACRNSRCISSVYVQNIHRLEPTTQAMIGKQLQGQRLKEMREYNMERAYA